MSESEESAEDLQSDLEALIPQGWKLANGRNVDAALRAAEESPEPLSIVKAVRLNAISELRSECENEVRRGQPQKADELQECLRTPFSRFVDQVLDAVAEREPSAARDRIPDVLDDVFRPMYGQLSTTIFYLAELLGLPQSKVPGIELTKSVLWRSVGEEALAGPISRSLEAYLRRRLETRALRYREAAPNPGKNPNDGDGLEDRISVDTGASAPAAPPETEAERSLRRHAVLDPLLIAAGINSPGEWANKAGSNVNKNTPRDYLNGKTVKLRRASRSALTAPLGDGVELPE